MLKIAIVGGGWAGIAAAVEATRLGHAATLIEMSGQLGGRARSVRVGGRVFDNGQHILIGAYSETLALMKTVGVDLDAALWRMPLQVLYPDGSGLKMSAGPPVMAFLKAVAGYQGWTWGQRLSLWAAATRWSITGFRCHASWTVARLTRGLPAVVRTEFIDPLCVAALNTPSHQASARVFLRVLKDALFSGPGSADLLLPRHGLDALLPKPAAAWLTRHGAALRTGTRVAAITADKRGATTAWNVDGEVFDAVVIACTAAEAARLARPLAPDWSALAGALTYEPIVTVYVQANGGRRLQAPMLALRSDATRPAQFVFDHGQLSAQDGLMALVVSGAASWLASGLAAVAAAARAQFLSDLPSALGRGADDAVVVQTLSEKRATFLCTPGLQRPVAQVAAGLVAAGDYVVGPYPATLEGAVRSGLHAVRLIAGPS